MDKRDTPRLRKGILLVVCSIAIVFLACGTWIGIWSAKEMKGLIIAQFNEEQLLLARNVSSSIERELTLLVKEISLLAKEISAEPVDREA